MEYNKKDYYILKNEYGQVLFIGRLKHIRRRFRYLFGYLPALSIPKKMIEYGYTIELAYARGFPSLARGTLVTSLSPNKNDRYNSNMANLKDKLKELPHKPGTYLFKDGKGRVLYVGKAKDLRNRVMQYFGADTRPQLPYLMQEAADLDYTVVGTELESLFLENTLIKQYLPPYNIKLRDDKNYAFIKIDYSTPIPQIGYARKIEDETQPINRHTTKQRNENKTDTQGLPPKPYTLNPARYFGPYSSARKIKKTLDFVRKIFPYCANKEPSKRPCFYYYLHRCPGICVGNIPMEEYTQQLKRIEQFLKGDTASIRKELKREMQSASSHKQFERAARLRDQFQALQVLDERQTMMFPQRVTWDFVSVYEEYGDACVNLFKIREGKLIDKENFIYSTVSVIPAHEPGSRTKIQSGFRVPPTPKLQRASTPGMTPGVLEKFLENYYGETNDLPKEIYIASWVENKKLLETLLQSRAHHKIPITPPTRGKKLSLIKLGVTNAQEYLRKWQASQATNTDAINNTLAELQKLLKLPTLPRRIEGYDISNTQGTNPVSSMVVSKDGLPAKSEYRKFKINVKQTPDDFAMMKETISRRLRHLSTIRHSELSASRVKNLDPSTSGYLPQDDTVVWPRPDLIVIDGGKGQLNAALEAQHNFQFPISNFQTNSKSKIQNSKLSPTPLALSPIPMIGLAKRIEEIFLPNNPTPIVLSHDNPVLQLLQRLRDEAHRFGITFHRQLRSKQATKSALDTIPGIGPKTKKLLKSKFGTVATIKSKSIDELAEVLGKPKAEQIKKYL